MVSAIQPPGNVDTYARPVQFEGASFLCGAEVPVAGGTSILTWVNSNRVRCAVVESSREWSVDSSVTSGMTHTVMSGGDVHAASCFYHNGGLYITVMRHLSGAGLHEIYKAIDTNNPAAGWSLYSTIESRSVSATQSFLSNEMMQSGIPHINGSTWVYTGGRWNNVLGYRFARCGLWVSTDGGVTWVNKVDQGFYLVGGSYIDWIPSSIIVDGITGYYYFVTGGGSGGQDGSLWESTDGGVTWAVVYNWNGADPFPSLFGVSTANGETYVARPNAGRIERMLSLPSNPNNRSTYSTHPPLNSNQSRACVAGWGTKILLFYADRVINRAGGGWTVGFVGM